MFRQSLIQVFKGLAEFHGYMPVTPLQIAEPETVKTTSQTKCAETELKQPLAVNHCCPTSS